MPAMTIAQLEQQHATNEHRQALFANFQEELASWYLGGLHIWLFGSYLAEKVKPGDIDILLAGQLKPGTPFPPKLPRQHKATVHVISDLGTGDLATKERLVQKFNEQDGNAAKGIQLSVDHVTDLLL